MTKRTSPSSARRTLKAMWNSVAVYSCADGTFKIEPRWNKRRFPHPGVITRMASAYWVECVLNMPKHSINWKKRLNAARDTSKEGQ